MRNDLGAVFHIINTVILQRRSYWTPGGISILEFYPINHVQNLLTLPLWLMRGLGNSQTSKVYFDLYDHLESSSFRSPPSAKGTQNSYLAFSTLILATAVFFMSHLLYDDITNERFVIGSCENAIINSFRVEDSQMYRKMRILLMDE